jgi:hypothetical protein
MAAHSSFNGPLLATVAGNQATAGAACRFNETRAIGA